MAPEQAARREIDTRSDIYLLGCIAYFLLTGTLVFPGPSPAEMMSQHIRVAPTPLAQRCRYRLPGGLEQLIMQCLEKRPEARPQTVAHLAACLRRIPLSEPWTPERARALALQSD
jgi:serine/threonine-protein kinase